MRKKLHEKASALILVIVGLYCFNLNATTYTQIAAGNWTNPSRWDPNGPPSLPLMAGDIIILDFAGNSTLNLSNLTLPTMVTLEVRSGVTLVVPSAAGTFTNDGSITIESGASFTVNGTASFVNNTGTLENDGTITNNNVMTNQAMGEIVNRGTINVAQAAGDSYTNHGMITNESTGTISNRSSFTNSATGVIENDGTFSSGNSTGDTFTNAGALTNNGDFVIANGSGTNSGMIDIGAAGTFENRREFTNTGSGTIINDGEIETGNSNGDLFYNTGTLENNNLFTVTGGSATNQAGATFTNNSTLTNNRIFMNDGTLVNESFITTGDGPADAFVNNATFTNNAFVTRTDGSLNNNGLLQGNGFVNTSGGTFTNLGTISPGSPGSAIGSISITGNFTNLGSILIQVTGTSGVSDVLSISGTATLNGTATVSLGPGVLGDEMPTESFNPVTYGSLSGSSTLVPSFVDAGWSYFYIATPPSLLLMYGGGPLDIKLTSFSGNRYHNQIKLNWTVSAEKDNEFIAVERSSDGVAFSEIGRVPGKGDSNGPLHYEFLDESPLQGNNYYRLRQVDLSGAFEYHPVIWVPFISEENSGFSVKLSPNPVVEQLNISWNNLTLTKEAKIYVNIFDLQGKLVHQAIVSGNNGIYPLPVNAFPAGNYIVSISDNKGVFKSEKFIKQ